MIKPDSKVKLHLKASLADGRVFFDTHLQGGIPIEVDLGKQELLPQLNTNLVGLDEGDRTTIKVEAQQAFGLYDPSLIEKVERASIPNAEVLPVGEYIMFNTDMGPIRTKVVDVTDDEVTFDHNHELADQDVIYQIDVLKVIDSEFNAVEHEKYYHEEECGCKNHLHHEAQ